MGGVWGWGVGGGAGGHQWAIILAQDNECFVVHEQNPKCQTCAKKNNLLLSGYVYWVCLYENIVVKPHKILISQTAQHSVNSKQTTWIYDISGALQMWWISSQLRIIVLPLQSFPYRVIPITVDLTVPVSVCAWQTSRFEDHP